jgi:hypothetical protein
MTWSEQPQITVSTMSRLAFITHSVYFQFIPHREHSPVNYRRQFFNTDYGNMDIRCEKCMKHIHRSGKMESFSMVQHVVYTVTTKL